MNKLTDSSMSQAMVAIESIEVNVGNSNLTEHIKLAIDNKNDKNKKGKA